MKNKQVYPVTSVYTVSWGLQLTLKSNVYILSAKTFKQNNPRQAKSLWWIEQPKTQQHMLILMSKKRARKCTHGSKNGHAKNYNAGDIIHSDRNKLGKLTSFKSEVRLFECHFQRIDYLPLGVWNALHAVEFAPIPLFYHEFKARYFFFHTTLLLSQSRKHKESHKCTELSEHIWNLKPKRYWVLCKMENSQTSQIT